jgi:hypothetical protein
MFYHSDKGTTLFSEQSISEWIQEQQGGLRKAIQEVPIAALIRDADQQSSLLVERFEVVLPVLQMEQKTAEINEAENMITFHFPFTGTPELFSCRPDAYWPGHEPAGRILDHELVFTAERLINQADLEKQVNDHLANIHRWLDGLNKNITPFVRDSLTPSVTTQVQQRLQRYQQTQSILEKMGYPLKPSQEPSGTPE